MEHLQIDLVEDGTHRKTGVANQDIDPSKLLDGRVDQLLTLLSQAEDLDTIIVLQNRLTDVRYQIESAESRVRVLENQVQYATLTLTLNEVLEEKEIEEPHVVTYGEKVSNQFKQTWEKSSRYFII